MNVATEAAVVALVNAHVDHDGAGLDPLAGHLLGTTHGDDKQIGPPRHGGGVASAGVADRHGRVAARPFLKQEKRHGLAHDLGSAQDDRTGTTRFDPGVNQQFADTQRRARDEPRSSCSQEPKIKRVEAIDVLERVNPLDHGRLVDRLRQRELHEDAMNSRIGIQAVDCGQELFLSRRAG